MRIAVTGGNGFIGRAVMLVGANAGHDMWSFDRANGHDVLGSLTPLDDFKPDVVIHLAGVLGTHELFDKAEHAVTVNVTGTLRVLEWCKENLVGYVGITMPPVFQSVYTATKVCADRLATAWHREFNVPVAKVCTFNAFGPGQPYGPGHPQKIIPTFATYAWRREPIPIWGDGEQTVDLIDVVQIARVLIDAASFGDDVTIDAGSGQAFTVNQVADMVLSVTGSGAGVQHLPMRRGEVPTKIVAEGRGWDRLRWKPSFAHDVFVTTVNSYHATATGLL